MLNTNLLSIFVGVITTIFSSYVFISHNEELLLLPSIQLILGLVTANMLVSGISAFRRMRKRIRPVLYFHDFVYAYCYHSK